jgi:hypothetical protein
MQAQSAARCTLALAAALLPASVASAAPRDRPSADAAFESYDPTGCVNTEVAVFVRGAKADSSGSASEQAKVHLAVTVLNECEDIALLKAEGKAKLKDGEFRVSPDLKSAALNATITMSVFGSKDKEKFDATVALTWTSVEGAISADVSTVPEELGRFEKTSAPVRRTLRLAEASGTISNGTDNFTPETSTDASISLVRPKSK